MPRTFKCVDRDKQGCMTCKYGYCYVPENCYFIYCVPCLDFIDDYCPLHNPNGNCNKCKWEAKDNAN